MASLEEVQARITAATPSPRATTVPVRDALGLVLASEVVSGEQVPPFANTAMDGYAVRAGDTADASADAPAPTVANTAGTPIERP